MKCILILSVILAINACSHNASVQVAPAINIYSGYADLVPGKFGVYVNDREFVSKADKATFECSAHRYPVDARMAFKESTIRTAQNIFSEVEVLDMPLRGEQLLDRNLDGILIIEGTLFRPRLDVDQNFWSADMEASVDIGISAEIYSRKDRIFASRVGATGRGEKDAGVMCGGGAPALGLAAELAIQDVLERIAERIVNSLEVRHLATISMQESVAAENTKTETQPAKEKAWTVEY